MVKILIFSFIITVLGFVGVQKTGNYENTFGFMFIWGAIGFLITLIAMATNLL